MSVYLDVENSTRKLKLSELSMHMITIVAYDVLDLALLYGISIQDDLMQLVKIIQRSINWYNQTVNLINHCGLIIS